MDSLTNRLKRDGDDRGGQDRKPEIRLAALPQKVADPDHDRDIDQGDEGGHRAEEERLVDHDVDVVKVVFEDCDPGGGWNADQRAQQDDVESGQDLADLLARGDEHNDSDKNHRPRGRQPLQLLPLN